MKNTLLILILISNLSLADDLTNIKLSNEITYIKDIKVKGVKTITSAYGENHKVFISRNFPNIIKTPFSKVNTVGLNEDYDLGYNGSSLIVTPRNNKSIWISITDEDNPNNIPISLTLVPSSKLNSQTIVISTTTKAGFNNNNDSGFSQKITNILKNIVMEKLPLSFNVSPLKDTFTFVNNIKVYPIEKYSSSEFDIYRYRLKNISSQTYELSEEAFGANDNVVAVTFYPNIILKSNETTDVLIMIGKGD